MSSSSATSSFTADQPASSDVTTSPPNVSASELVYLEASSSPELDSEPFSSLAFLRSILDVLARVGHPTRLSESTSAARDQCSTVTALVELLLKQQTEKGFVLNELRPEDLETMFGEALSQLNQAVKKEELDELSEVIDYVILENVLYDVSEGSVKLTLLLMIDKFTWKVESKCGVHMSLDYFIEVIETTTAEILSHHRLGQTTHQIACDLDGLFTSRIPCDDMWGGQLFSPEGVNIHRQLHQRPRFTADCPMQVSNARSRILLLSLPVEIIRHILHCGAESLLPVVRSSLADRKTLHLRRSHFLTNAALSHSLFRQQAQRELLSFAYCYRGFNLHGLLDFVGQEDMSGCLTRLRLDCNIDEVLFGERGAFGDSLGRLFKAHLPALFFIDFGGAFTKLTFSLLSQGSLKPVALCFSHLWTKYCPETYSLPTSVTTLSLDCCLLNSLTTVVRTERNILKLTVTSHPGDLPAWNKDVLVPAKETPALFPNVRHLRLDCKNLSFEQSMLEFPSVTLLELLEFDQLSEETSFTFEEDGWVNLSKLLNLMSNKAGTKTLIFPPMLEDPGTKDKEWRKMGFVMRQKKELDSVEGRSAFPQQHLLS